MSAHVIIELDVSPPMIGFGIPYQDGTRLRIPYLIDEPGIVAAEILNKVATVTDDDMSVLVHLPQGGHVPIRVLLRDDVDNARLITDEVWVAPQTGSVSSESPGYSPDTGTGIVERPTTGRVKEDKTDSGIVERPGEGHAEVWED